jgi:hypothetical protein
MRSKLLRFGSVLFACATFVAVIAPPVRAADEEPKPKAEGDEDGEKPKKRKKKAAEGDTAPADEAKPKAEGEGDEDGEKPKKRRKKKEDADEEEGAKPAKPAKPATPPPPPEAGPTDHARHVGRFGIGYFGSFGGTLATVTTTATGTTVTPVDVSAPLVGVRYWLQPGLALDVALGFYSNGGSTSSGGTSQDDDSKWAIALKAGVPISMYEGTHYVLFVEPEIYFGHASGTHHNGPNAPDDSIGGTHISIGGRAGAEVSFGFIGIPMLSLDATLGLALDYSSTTYTPGDSTQSATSHSSMTIGTFTSNSPWNIFTSNVAARYYF